MKKLFTIIGLASLLGLEVAAQPVYVAGGGVRATNRPIDFAGNYVLYGFTNADGSVTHRYGIVVATSTNAIHEVLSNLIVTVSKNVTNVGPSNGLITAGTLFQAPVQIETNLQVLNAANVIGVISASNNILALRSNVQQIGSSTLPWSNIFAVRLMGPNAQGTFTNPPTGFGSIQWSNGVPYSVQPDGTIHDLTAIDGAGTAVYIDTAHTNITAKGLTIQNALDYEVVTVSGTTPSIDATNSPQYYIELSGNTTPTFANFPVGRMVSILVSNGAQHTLTWPVNITWLNQNTPPGVTTNGYTHYQFFRPTTTITQAMVLGKELEFTNDLNVQFFTNASGTRLSMFVRTNSSSQAGLVMEGSFGSSAQVWKLDSMGNPSWRDEMISFDSLNANSFRITNNITYRAPALVVSGNSTQYAGNYDIGWNIINLTNCLHVTGMVNVAAANLGKAWILVGQNLTSSNNTVSVSPLFHRAGTNFVVVPAGKRFRLSVMNDGSGGVNETNQLGDIQVYDSP